jgi:hypothetical protein
MEIEINISCLPLILPRLAQYISFTEYEPSIARLAS